jgi:hypothetical protein
MHAVVSEDRCFPTVKHAKRRWNWNGHANADHPDLNLMRELACGVAVNWWTSNYT